MLHRAAFFNADYDLFTSMYPVWLQGSFDTLAGLSKKVGLQKNVRKTVGMLCRPYRTVGTQSEAAYKWRMTGEGITYRVPSAAMGSVP